MPVEPSTSAAFVVVFSVADKIRGYGHQPGFRRVVIRYTDVILVAFASPMLVEHVL